ncbi:MAG: AAA family ATPase [Planctomycetaceae bacterium]|jgi:predicted AAA+ superfamily ATPase|nr:AAA family ATPase [Planctomycetaceae bacterium]
MNKSKYTESQKDFAREQLISCTIYRDSLPYHETFDQLFRLYNKSGLPKLSERDFWLLLIAVSKEEKIKQTNASKLPAVIVSQEERHELIRLFPDKIGKRYLLPYTDEFESVYREFVSQVDNHLTKNEFWRALVKALKSVRKEDIISGKGAYHFSHEQRNELVSMNPWWNGGNIPDVPDYKRSIFHTLCEQLTDFTRYKPYYAIRGPRQVGKTTVIAQLIKKLLDEKITVPSHILCFSFDNSEILKLEHPLLHVVRWFENNIVKDTFNNVWKKNQPVFLFLDEVQDVPDWSLQLKNIIDAQMCKCLITGSSALRILAGRESLPGRLDYYNVNSLSLSEIADFYGKTIPPFRDEICYVDLVKKDFWVELCNYNPPFLDETFEKFSELGGYPFCHVEGASGFAARKRFLQNNVTRRTIEHDIRTSIGKAPIVEGYQNVTFVREIFRVICKYTGCDVNYSTLCREIEISTGTHLNFEQLNAILNFFDNSMLFKMIRPPLYRMATAKNRIKPCLCDHAIRAAWIAEEVQLYGDSVNADIAGRIAEGIVGYLLASIDGILDVNYLPPHNGDGEIDFVLAIGDKHIPIEVKYQNTVTPPNNLKKYINKKIHNAPFGIVITKNDAYVNDQIIAIPLKQFLLLQ